MLQRTFIHVCLILLFAFTQMGVATHEISHFTDEQQQQDKNHQQSQCEQCLVLSHAASAPLAYSFVFASTPLEQLYFAELSASAFSRTATLYSARAPPSHSSI